MTGRLGYLRLGYGRLGSDDADGAAPLTVTAPAIAVAVAVPTPALTLGAITVVVPPIAVAVAVPAPSLGLTVTAPAVAISVTLPAPALPIILAAPAVELAVAIPAPSLPLRLTAPAVGVGVALPAPALPVVLAVPALEVPVAIPTPSAHVGSGVFVDAEPLAIPVTLPAPAVRVGLRIWPPPIALAVGTVAPRVTIGAVDVELPTPLVFELTINGSTIDVSSMVVGDFEYERPLDGVPTGTVRLEDPDGTIPWPPDPGIDPFAETVGALPFLRVTGTDVLLEGHVREPERRELWPGFELTLRVDGWRRLAQLSPVQPLTGATTEQASPDGTVVTADAGGYIGAGGGGGSGRPDSLVIQEAALWFTGPLDLDTSDVPYGGLTTRTLVPRGQSLETVLEQLARGDTWWIGPGPALHVRPAITAGTLVSDYRGPSRAIAPFRITDDFTDADGIVPTALVDSLKGSDVREGVYVTDVAPWYSGRLSSGPSGAGYDLLGSGSGEPGYASMIAGNEMLDRRAFRRVLTVELPEWPVGWSEPTEGMVVSVRYGATVPEPALYTIRNVRGTVALLGQARYTLELGDAGRRSYVGEIRRDRGIAAKDQPLMQIGTLETSTISDLGVPAEGDPPIPQYVTARPVSASGERIELWGGLVDWSILIDDVDVGANVGDGAGLGWSLADETTDVVFEYGDDARRFGFAYTTLLTWRTEPSIAGGRRIKVRAELRTGL